MKKWVAIFLVIVLAVFIVYYDDPRVKSFLERETEQILPEQLTHSTVYRWRDKQGRMVVSDKPPADGTPYETVQYHRDTNVIPKDKLTGKSDN